MDVKIFLGAVSAILAFVSSFIYILDIFRGNSRPHTYTWLIWSIVTSIAFFGQLTSGGGPGAWSTGASALLTTFTLFLSLKGGYGSKDITNFDKLCLVFSLIAILPWLLAKSVLWSVILATAIDLIAFFPTMRKTWYAPKSESLGSMYVDAAKHSLSIFSMGSYSLVNVIYPASVLLTKFVIIGEIVFLRKLKKPAFKYLLFDYDGCLADTLSIWRDAYKETFNIYGVYPTSNEITEKVFGAKFESKVFGVEDVEGFRKILKEKVSEKFRLAPLHKGVKETILELKKMGKKMSIVTSYKKGEIEHVLEQNGIKDCFDFILDRYDVTEYKPHPEMIYKAIKNFGGKLEESVIIGDNDKDILAGNKANIARILYYPIEHESIYTKEYISSLHPTFFIRNFSEIIKIVT